MAQNLNGTQTWPHFGQDLCRLLMLRDGIYRINYPGTPRSKRKRHVALASCRKGQIFASDEYGGLYHGLQDRRGPGQPCPVNVVVRLPPGGSLVTGRSTKNGAVVLELRHVPDVDDFTTATALLNGAPLEIEISYLGPLPA